MSAVPRTMAVPSPCIQVCRLDAAQLYCEGCWRTVGEITAWPDLSNAQKIRLWRELRERRQALQGRPGG